MTDKKTYSDLIWRADQFIARPIPPRTWLLEGAIPHPSIGMLYAWRGTGKTYNALDMSLAIAAGKPWMHYTTVKHNVLYIDGEMPLGDMRMRVDQLAKGLPSKQLYLLASEDLAVARRNLNLAHKPDRDELSKAIVKFEKQLGDPFGLIVLDNWTSLVRGIDENDNAAIDPIKEWLVLLRHGNHSVLLVHHAGKGGAQRGASSREDLLDYSAELSEELAFGKESRFRFRWDKTRTGRPDPDNFIEILEQVNGHMELRAAPEAAKGVSKRANKETMDKVLSCLPATFRTIKQETGLLAPQITRTLDYLEREGAIALNGNDEYVQS